MIADPEGPSFITRTVGRRWYADDASVSHDPFRTSGGRSQELSLGSDRCRSWQEIATACKLASTNDVQRRSWGPRLAGKGSWGMPMALQAVCACSLAP